MKPPQMRRRIRSGAPAPHVRGTGVLGQTIDGETDDVGGITRQIKSGEVSLEGDDFARR